MIYLGQHAGILAHTSLWQLINLLRKIPSIFKDLPMLSIKGKFGVPTILWKKLAKESRLFPRL